MSRDTNLPQSGAAGCPRSLRLLIGAHALLALTLLSDPAGLLSRLGETTADPNMQRFARILGARHLLEAIVLIRRHDDAGSIFAAAGLDATHAVTMLGLAHIKPERRRIAQLNAILATTICCCGVGCGVQVHASARRAS